MLSLIHLDITLFVNVYLAATVSSSVLDIDFVLGKAKKHRYLLGDMYNENLQSLANMACGR